MTAAATTSTSTDRTETSEPSTLRWWKEVLLALVFYGIYSRVRNAFGAGPESREIAFSHAQDVIRVERFLHLFVEPRIQQWYLNLPSHGFIRLWNIYYGTAHFVITIGVLIIAYRRVPERYRFIRNTLAGTTGLALIGFASFTLMPPRLLGSTTPYGACYRSVVDCHGYGIVDTLERWGGSWKFGSGPMAAISNQYAAMPSLHIGWSTWCALTMVLVIGRGWKRWLWFTYPAITLLCIIITGNHYWLDAFFGLWVLAGGTLIAIGLERLRAVRGGRDPDDAVEDLPPHLIGHRPDAPA